MLKISKWLIAISMALLVLPFGQATQKAYAYQPIDQVNSNGIDGYWRINSHQWVGQTFTPTKNRLDAIGVRASGAGLAS